MNWKYRSKERSKDLIEDLKKLRNIVELKDFYPTSKLHDIDKAVERVTLAIKNKDKIIIHGDFDADGICATSIIFDYLYFHAKANVVPYIPSRIDEGYGISESSLLSIKEKYSKNGEKLLIISVDCGIKDYELIDNKWHKEFDFIITDHHEMGEGISKKAIAIVHPKLDKYPEKNISGSAVSWKLVSAINEKLKLTDVRTYLDLVAISTICDVMPLTGENRYFVREGLEVLNSTTNIGLNELIKISQIRDTFIDTYHIGFVLGPRINAAGRMGEPLDAVKLLCTKSTTNAEILASKLDSLNRSRQEITERLLKEADIQAKAQKSDKIIIIEGKDWEEGIIGLVAGKVTEEYERPCIVLSIRDGKVKGSSRSTSKLDITKTLSLFSKHLEKFGGHFQAAGLSLKEENLTKFVDDIKNYVNSLDFSIEKDLNIDFEVDLKEIKLDTVKQISTLKPFGNANPEPVFSSNSLKVSGMNYVGVEKNHLKINLSDEKKETISAIMFNVKDGIRKIKVGDKVDIAYTLSSKPFNGMDQIDIKLKDIHI